jgi:hypothetical protein
VIEDLVSLDGLDRSPWRSRYLQGLIDAPFLTLSPGTRSGVIQVDRYAAFLTALAPLEARLDEVIAEQQRAEEEQASRQSMRAIQRALHEALLALPPEEYDWFEVQGPSRRGGSANSVSGDTVAENEVAGVLEPELPEDPLQRRFFEFAGPLHAVVISPASSTVPLRETRAFKALTRDRSRRRVQDGLQFIWAIAEGEGSLRNPADQEVLYEAPSTPGLARLKVTVAQQQTTCAKPKR